MLHRSQLLALALAVLVSTPRVSAQTATPAGLATFDSATSKLSLPDVVVANTRYAVEMSLQANGLFRLTSAQPIQTAIAASPATYDVSQATLDVPKVLVASKYYSARLLNTGDFNFQIQQTSETSALSNKTAWKQTAFRSSTAPIVPRHVNRVVVGTAGRVFAAWYSQDIRAYVSYTDDGGSTWTHKELDRMLQIHQMIRLQNGTLVVGGESFGNYPVLWYSQDNGQTWKTGASGLPNSNSSMIWDLAERAGEVIITTSSETNVATQSHPVVYAWNPTSGNLRTLASLPGIGALAVAATAEGTLFVSTQDSAEHDDPTKAGEGRVYRSNDGGASWSQTGTLASANRIYALTALVDGSVIAGSGLNGGFYRTGDGNTWTLMTTLPAGKKVMGNPPLMTDIAVTRVYKVLELASGALLVGTGNTTGDLLLTCDLGASWIDTERTGNNNVVWGLAQESDGTVWIGNGSEQGDVWKAKPPSGISAWQHFSCM